MTNPHEQIARIRKATAITDYLWGLFEAPDRISDLTVQLVRGARQDVRDTIAHNAGQKSPSAETWALVVADLERRVEAAQSGARAVTV
jgi:hypothetical protein